MVSRKRQVVSVFLFILLSTLLGAALYYGYLAPNNEYESYNAFPRIDMEQPTGFFQRSDNADYNYVTEKAGKILVFKNTPTASDAEVFLDLTDRVDSGSTEDGMLGLAFHPDFATNGKVYTYHTEHQSTRYGIDDTTCTCLTTILTEWRVDANNPLKIDRSTERTILELNQTTGFHRGGQMLFDEQGYMFVQLGEGNNQTEAQNLNSFKGKILRIDVDDTSSGPYGIPADNPFVGVANVSEEIYAYGFRNPWRGGFDPLTGDYIVSDVGEAKWEEIDVVEPGKNYGWNEWEGFECGRLAASCPLPNTTFPIFAYPHPANIPLGSGSDDPSGIGIVGGNFYRATGHPDLTGSFIMGDYSGSVYRIDFDRDYNLLDTEFLFKIPDFMSHLTFDENGEVVMVGIYIGSVRKIRQATLFAFVTSILVYLTTVFLLLVWNLPKLRQRLVQLIKRESSVNT